MIRVFEPCGFQQPTSAVPACPPRYTGSMIAPPQRVIRARHGFSRDNVKLIKITHFFIS